MQGTVLETVDHHPYLGIELTSNLNWNRYINNVVGNANRILGFLRRNLTNCSELIKNKAYPSFVHPRLEYASAVWDRRPRSNIEGVSTMKVCQICQGMQLSRTRNSYKLTQRAFMANICSAKENFTHINNAQNS